MLLEVIINKVFQLKCISYPSIFSMIICGWLRFMLLALVSSSLKEINIMKDNMKEIILVYIKEFMESSGQ